MEKRVIIESKYICDSVREEVTQVYTTFFKDLYDSTVPDKHQRIQKTIKDLSDTYTAEIEQLENQVTKAAQEYIDIFKALGRPVEIVDASHQYFTYEQIQYAVIRPILYRLIEKKHVLWETLKHYRYHIANPLSHVQSLIQARKQERIKFTHKGPRPSPVRLPPNPREPR